MDTVVRACRLLAVSAPRPSQCVIVRTFEARCVADRRKGIERVAIQIDLVGEDRVDVVADDIVEFIGRFSKHLSREGIFLETDLILERGRELELTLRLADGFALVRGSTMVAWQRQQQEGSTIPSGVALHLLEIKEGTEFLDRLVREHESAGGVPFTVDREAPLTIDGSPPPADALDQMMAQRGDQKPTATLKDVQATDRTEVLNEDSPDFAPGFGKAGPWDREVAPEIPGQVTGWLEEQSAAVRPPVARPAAETVGTPSSAIVPPPAGSATPSSSPASVPSADSEEAAPAVPAASVPASSVPASGLEASTLLELPEIELPTATAKPEPTIRPRPAQKAQASRSGPIKMKLAADRQPGSDSIDPAQAGAPSGSFVEASRRVTELMKEGSKPSISPTSSGSVTGRTSSGSASQAEDPALATVAIKPGEIAQMLKRQEAAQSSVGGRSDSAASSAEPELSRLSQQLQQHQAKAPVAPATGSATASVVETGSAESGTYQSQLVVDPDVVSEADLAAGYGLPEEDRTPMVVIGVLVAVIVIALIVWGLVS